MPSTLDGAESLLQEGMLAEAEAVCRKLVSAEPNAAAGWNKLAVALSRQARWAEAEPCARRAVELQPASGECWRTLGNCLYRMERWPEAADAFRESLAHDPADAAAWNNLGAVEQRLGRLAQAEEAYERCLAVSPSHVGAMSNLAFLLKHRGQRERAAELLLGVMAHQPQAAGDWILLGNAWELLNHLEQAAAAHRRALELDPNQNLVRYKLAPVLERLGRLEEAEAQARRLVADEPQSADAWGLLGRILHTQGRIAEAVESLRRSIELLPRPEHHSLLVRTLQYADGVTPQETLHESRRWAALHAAGATVIPPPVRRRNAQEPLRLGLVSGNFAQHPLAFLVLPALEHLDKRACSIVCYADQENEDAYTARFRAVANVWRPVFGLSSDELAQQICRDEIDVLVDLMGHTGNRLPVFAQRPAAVQVTWFGDVGTTGLDVIDFLLADRFHVRPGEEEFYIETVLRLPHGYACYGPPADAPEAGPLPALAAKEGDREQGTGDRGQRRSLARRAGVTFGCFNNPAKYTPSTLDAWAAILCGVPDSRLLLKYRVLDLPSVQQRLYAQFAQRGVPQEQVVLEGWSSHRELLAAYNRVDLALDTQPYSGGVTTCEALWMGVPVITYPGRTFAGRHAVSHLTNAGYGQFVAADAAGYVELAVRWAQRLPELAAIRARMREQVRQSPLCDAGGFARDLLAVLRQAWLMADRSRRGKTDCSGKSATGP